MNLYTKMEQFAHFTESEKAFVDFLINQPHEVVDCNVQQLSKKSYVSVSTIYRFMEKMEISGLTELKLQVSTHQMSYDQEKNVDYNYPFSPYNTHYEIMSKMDALYNQTIKSTRNLIDLEVFGQVVQTLYNYKEITIFPSIGNYFMAESFQQNMIEIGKKIDVVNDKFYQHWNSCMFNDTNVVMIISYANRTPHMLEMIKSLKERQVVTILISSTKETQLSQYADYHLYFSSYEDSEEKIASFSSRVSLQYLLDALFAAYFNRSYDQHLKHKLEHYID